MSIDKDKGLNERKSWRNKVLKSSCKCKVISLFPIYKWPARPIRRWFKGGTSRPWRQFIITAKSLMVCVKQSGQITRSDSSPITAGRSPRSSPTARAASQTLEAEGDFERKLNKAFRLYMQGSAPSRCALKVQFIICLTTSPQLAQKGITHSGRALHITSQKRLMVRCNFPLFPLIMWQAATPMSCAH